MSETSPPFSSRNIASIVNTILLTVVLGLSAWTLNKVSDLNISMAVGANTDKDQQRQIEDTRLRLAAIEVRQQELAIELVKVKAILK